MNQFETERLIIRNPKREDAFELFRNYTQDPEVTKYLTWKPHVKIDETIEFINHCISSSDNPSKIYGMIYLKEIKQVIGMLEFRIDNFKANFGYVLAKRFWNQGIMTEAMKPVLDHVCKMTNIYRVFSTHDIDNERSGRVMQKLGLKFEGILKRYMIHPNISEEPRDVKMYSLVK